VAVLPDVLCPQPYSLVFLLTGGDSHAETRATTRTRKKKRHACALSPRECFGQPASVAVGGAAGWAPRACPVGLDPVETV